VGVEVVAVTGELDAPVDRPRRLGERTLDAPDAVVDLAHAVERDGGAHRDRRVERVAEGLDAGDRSVGHQAAGVDVDLAEGRARPRQDLGDVGEAGVVHRLAPGHVHVGERSAQERIGQDGGQVLRIDGPAGRPLPDPAHRAATVARVDDGQHERHGGVGRQSHVDHVATSSHSS
jgi:hypothetical protein